MKRYFIFDLDGTLLDTGEGIRKCAQHTLAAFGITESFESLRHFIGPPLQVSFREHYGFSEEDTAKAVEIYRTRYREKGVYETRLYPGMKAFLERLSQKAVLCVATSKAEVFARQILEMREIAPYFQVIQGSGLDNSLSEKADLLQAVLQKLHGPDVGEAIMIGDRKYDIFGAKAQNMEAIGVTYGFPAPGELEAAGADYLVSSVPELERLCFSLL